MNGTEEIGCCGAYCKTCREYQKTCKGCKPGYLDGSRDLRRAKCKMKKCCLTRGHITCGDYESCETGQAFLNHPGYKYGKYKQALEFIRTHDYATFLKASEHWKNAYGTATPASLRMEPRIRTTTVKSGSRWKRNKRLHDKSEQKAWLFAYLSIP